MPTEDFRQVVSHLGITKEDVEETARKLGITDARKALAVTVFEKSQSPSLRTPEIDKMVKESYGEPKYDQTGRNLEALTTGAGTGLAGAIAGAPGGPLGSIAGALGGFGIGAGTSYIKNAANPAVRANDANRILDVAGPAMGAVTSMIPKASAATKGAVNTLLDMIGVYKAESKNQETGEGSPLTRTAMTGALGGALSSVGNRASRELSNINAVKELERMNSAPGALYGAPRAGGKFRKIDPQGVEDNIAEIIQYQRENPKAIGDPTRRLIAPKATQTITRDMIDTPEVKALIKDRPEKLYDYILSPVTQSGTPEDLKKAVPELAKRLKAVELLAGDKSAVDVSMGLRRTFYDSLAKNNAGTKLVDPGSFKTRLEAMGPEITNRIYGDPKGFEKLTELSGAASEASKVGKFLTKMGDGKIVILSPLARAGEKGYQVYQFGVDKVLDKANKKTLEILTKGLQNSSSNAIVNKFTEWLSENADDSFTM